MGSDSMESIEASVIAIAKETDKVSSELESIKGEVVEIEEKVREKAAAKARAERRIAELASSIGSEKGEMNEEVAALQAQLARLKAGPAEGRSGAALRARLEAEAAEKARISRQQEELRKEVSELQGQLEEEERRRARLEESAKRKEDEKRKLQLRHRIEMKKLKQRLLESTLTEERYKEDIGRTIKTKHETTEQLYRLQGDVSETRSKLVNEVAVKQEISAMKRRIREEMDRTNRSLTTTTKDNKKADLIVGRLERTQRKAEFHVDAERLEVRRVETEKVYAEVEAEELLDEHDGMVEARQKEELSAVMLEAEKEEVEDDIEEEADAHRQALRKLDAVHRAKVQQLRRKHDKDAKKLSAKAGAALDELNELTQDTVGARHDRLVAEEKARDLTRQIVVTEQSIELTQMDIAESEKDKARTANFVAKDKSRITDMEVRVQSTVETRHRLAEQTQKLTKQGDEERTTRLEIDKLKMTLRSEMANLKERLDDETRHKARADRSRQKAEEEVSTLHATVTEEEDHIRAVVESKKKRLSAELFLKQEHLVKQARRVKDHRKTLEAEAVEAQESAATEADASRRAEREASLLKTRARALAETSVEDVAAREAAEKKKKEFERQLAKARAALADEDKARKKKLKDKSSAEQTAAKKRDAVRQARAAREAAENSVRDAEDEAAAEARRVEMEVRKKRRELADVRRRAVDDDDDDEPDATQEAKRAAKARVKEASAAADAETAELRAKLLEEKAAEDRKRRDLEKLLAQKEQELENARAERAQAERLAQRKREKERKARLAAAEAG